MRQARRAAAPPVLTGAELRPEASRPAIHTAPGPHSSGCEDQRDGIPGIIFGAECLSITAQCDFLLVATWCVLGRASGWELT